MATEKWVAGSGATLTWTDAFSGASLNSLANGNALLSGIDIANGGSTLDMFADISLVLATTAAISTPGLVHVGIYPLSDDASHYGDGRFTSAAAGNIPGMYLQRTIQLVGGSTGPHYGQALGLVLPPGTFRFVIQNSLGQAFAASGNTLKYRTYNRQVT